MDEMFFVQIQISVGNQDFTLFEESIRRDQSTEFVDDTTSRRKTARTRSSQRFLLMEPENENPQAPFAERGYLEPPQTGGSMRLPFAHVVDVRQDFLSKIHQALIPAILLTSESVGLC
jgi:hypothetical protein